MKKLIALLLAAMMVFAVCACTTAKTGDKAPESKTAEPVNTQPTAESATAEPTTAAESATTEANPDEVKVMTYEEYAAAALDTKVVVETYVQAKQSWWDNKATVYTQDENGGYFLYNMACTEEQYATLVPGQKIRVTGFKAEWAGEIEISDATFELLEGNYVAEVLDVTDKLGTEELATYMNRFVAFKGLTVEAYDDEGNAFAYKNPENKTDDLYFKASIDGKTYDFCVEYYLCNNDTEVYKAVEALKVGDKIDMEGFLYWYNGSNPHITSVKASA